MLMGEFVAAAEAAELEGESRVALAQKSSFLRESGGLFQGLWEIDVQHRQG